MVRPHWWDNGRTPGADKKSGAIVVCLELPIAKTRLYGGTPARKKSEPEMNENQVGRNQVIRNSRPSACSKGDPLGDQLEEIFGRIRR